MNYQIYDKNVFQNTKRSENRYKNNNKKNIVQKPGDWFCPKCNNMNFAFRTICNRCHLPK